MNDHPSVDNEPGVFGAVNKVRSRLADGVEALMGQEPRGSVDIADMGGKNPGTEKHGGLEGMIGTGEDLDRVMGRGFEARATRIAESAANRGSRDRGRSR